MPPNVVRGQAAPARSIWSFSVVQVILLLIFSLSFGKVLRSAPDIAKAYARFAMRSEMVDSYRLIHSVNQDMVAIKIQLDYLPPHLKVLETKATVVVVVLKLERGIGIYNHFVLKYEFSKSFLVKLSPSLEFDKIEYLQSILDSSLSLPPAFRESVELLLAQLAYGQKLRTIPTEPPDIFA